MRLNNMQIASRRGPRVAGSGIGAMGQATGDRVGGVRAGLGQHSDIGTRLDSAGSNAALSDLGFLVRLLDETDDGTELVAADGTLRYVNRAGAEGMYRGEASTVEGRDWVELWPAASRPVAAAALRDARAGRRARFKAAREGEGGTATWWDVSLIPPSSGGDPTTLAISRDVTATVAHDEQLAIVNAEMRHRLRNAFTIATSLTVLAARQQPEHRPFADHLIEAFRQYVAVQEVVLDPKAAKAFDKLLPMIMQAFGDPTMFEHGPMPEVDLPDNSVQALALTFGELCTNSLKHGGLRDGRPVKLSANVSPNAVEVVWDEVTCFGSPREGGQGLALIDRMVGVVGGAVEREVTPERLVTKIRLPR